MQRFLNIRNTCVRTFPSTPRVPISRLFNSRRPSSTYLNISRWSNSVVSLEKRKFHTNPWSSAERSKTLKGEARSIKDWLISIGLDQKADEYAAIFISKNYSTENDLFLVPPTKEEIKEYGIPPGKHLNLIMQNLKPRTQDQFDNLKAPDDKYKLLISNVLPRVMINLPPPLYDPKMQKELLGPFNKPEVKLPFAAQNIDLRLLGFGNEMTKAAQHIIHKLDSLKDKGSSSRYFAVCLGQSGCGKTRTIFDIASKHWVMFVECVPSGEERIEQTRDRNFGTLVNDIELIRMNISKSQLKTEEPVDNFDELRRKSEFQLKAEGRILVEILARLLYLRGLFIVNPALTPCDYLLGQINGGQDSITCLVDHLKWISNESATILLRELYIDLSENYLGKHRRLVVSLDEANVAMTKILHDKFINNNGRPRGLLTALTNVIVHTARFSPSVLYVGTALSLGVGAESIASDIGKTNLLDKVVDFPPSEESEIQDWFSKLLDLHGCEGVWEDPNVNWHELVGRQRLKAAVVTNISIQNKSVYNRFEPMERKKRMLANAIKSSIELHHKRMYSHLKRAAQDRPDVRNMVRDIVAISLLTKGAISFIPSEKDQQMRDLVSIGICQLVLSDNEEYHWILSEPLAVRVALEVLQDLGDLVPDVVLDKAIHMVYKVMKTLGPNCSEKGKFAEFLTAAQMLQWNKTVLGDIDVVKANVASNMIPKWMFELTFQVSKCGTARELGYDNDLAVIEAIKNGKIENVLLLPENNMRPDILWLKFQGGRWYAVVEGQKIHSRNIVKKTYDENNKSTSLSLVYHTKDGSEVNVEEKNQTFHRITDEAFRNDPSKLGGILRLHLLLPSVVTSCSRKSEVSNKEVCLYVTKDNLSSLFPSILTQQVLSRATRTELVAK